MFAYLKWPIGFTALGLALAGWLGWAIHGTIGGALSVLFIVAVLAALEISLSFDNAIVNANKLQQMRPEWRHRFLTWGILIAVFGMRIVFPLAIVAISARIDPWSAVVLAASKPDDYAEAMRDAHLSISAFGGAFLMMVSLGYFLDRGKEIHWLELPERCMCRIAAIRGIGVALVVGMLFAFTPALGPRGPEFLEAGLLGLMVYLGVELLGRALDCEQGGATMAKGGLGAFLYLEMLDASFSFDGVIGAFALSHNLFVIAIGLGVGAFYVRSLTIMLVERKTLAEYRYLEHGAFWSILALSLVMFAESVTHVPEVATGLIGVGLIGLSLRSSLRYNRRIASR